MRPIVDGLKEQYQSDVEFVYVNAGEDEGREAFNSLALSGHPSYVMFSVDKQETYRGLGPLDESVLREAIVAQIPGS